jgi:hypothetical protein
MSSLLSSFDEKHKKPSQLLLKNRKLLLGQKPETEFTLEPTYKEGFERK